MPRDAAKLTPLPDARPPVFQFAPSVEGAPSQHEDVRLALMAVCVALQQGAGFKNHIDIRQAECPRCKAPGFNSGWGVWRFTCLAEYLTDGEVAEPCPTDEELEPGNAP